MKIEYEAIHPDEGSSFKLLHQKVTAEHFGWEYHYHPEYEIVCVLAGNGTRHVGNHVSNYENGDLVFIGPKLPHAGFGLNATGPHEEIVIQIKEEVINQSLLTRPEMSPIGELLEKARYGINFTGNTKEKARKKLIKLLKLSPFERYIELLTILQLLATSSEYNLLNSQLTLSSDIRKHHSRIQHIFNYVEQNFQEEINIKEVADLVNLTVPSFCNYFKKVMNTTFTDFVNSYRIQQACILLQQEKTVAEVCFKCGFNNVTYFDKVFKSIMRKTPSEFKRKREQKN